MTQTTDINADPIERATSEDDVIRINEFFNRRVIKTQLSRFTYRTTLDRAFQRDDRRLFYLTADGDIIGALMVWCESRVLEDNEAQIRLVAVAPDHRRRGVAQRLCARAEAFARDYDMATISADVAKESDAVDFWRDCGYEVGYEWETDAGRMMYRMVKELVVSQSPQ